MDQRKQPLNLSSQYCVELIEEEFQLTSSQQSEVDELYSDVSNKFQIGKVVTGVILSKDNSGIIVGINYKSDGLIPAYELLINNNAVANLVREKRTHEINTVIETSSQDGMIDMNRSLAELVRSGEITVESAYMNSLNPKTLEKML